MLPDLEQVLRDPSLLEELFAALESGDKAEAGRASDSLEKVSAARPELIQPYNDVVLGLMGRMEHWLVRTHVCLMIPRLRLTSGERREAFELMRSFLPDKSSIVRTWAMQAMFELAKADESLRDEVMEVVDDALRNGTAAMKARARNILRKNKNPLRGTMAP